MAWLTLSVQLGFVAGTLVAVLLNLADRIPAVRLFAVSALAAATALIVLLDPGFTAAVALRMLTGTALAGVYPVDLNWPPARQRPIGAWVSDCWWAP